VNAASVKGGVTRANAVRRDVSRPVIRRLGLVEYEPTWRAMQRFTEERDETTQDEIWFLEHPPVLRKKK